MIMSDELGFEYCNNCSCQTRHECRFEDEVSLSVEYFYHEIKYRLLRCMGCGTELLEKTDVSDNSRHNIGGDLTPSVTRFPPPMYRDLPSWAYELIGPHAVVSGLTDIPLISLLGEIYTAVNHDCPAIAVMGIRAVLETVMIEKVGDNGNFIRNMKAFRDEGFISEIQYEVLNSLLELGHAAIHRAHTPSMPDVIAALDVTENIIHSVYIMTCRLEKSFKNLPAKKFKANTVKKNHF